MRCQQNLPKSAVNMAPSHLTWYFTTKGAVISCSHKGNTVLSTVFLDLQFLLIRTGGTNYFLLKTAVKTSVPALITLVSQC
jgi:hypothetical protein